MEFKLQWILVFLTGLFFQVNAHGQQQEHPNVIIVLTDDQGYGDLGITGNPHAITPAIDQFARESVRFNNFYVSPVCAPTRSSLMTGRYSLRTGMRDTYNGGATMASNEITIAEMLKQANYKTGIFGKWHLGDNYPSRPSEQGFDESLIHLSGGMGQVGDITNYFHGDSSYFNPTLWHNNKQESFEGYCSDIFAEQAISFIEKNKAQPFFCYLSFNAPHTPLQVPQKYYDKFKNIDPSKGFDQYGKSWPEMTESDKEDARRVYAMVNNIDDNLTKLFAKLQQLQIVDNTIVIFMTDNGPQQVRYVGGMRGRKGSVYQGGVRVPFYLRYPAAFGKNKDIATVSAHIDILPTLAELCHVNLPTDRKMDGHSLVAPILGKKVAWENRSLFFYWSRRYPELYNNMALRKGDYKLVGMTDYDASLHEFQMFNIKTDPFEKENIVASNLPKAKELKSELDRMYQELITSPNLVDAPRIIIGTKFENPVILNRNDAGGERGIWNQEEVYGNWRARIKKGTYDIKFKFVTPVKGKGQMYLETGVLVKQKNIADGETDIIEMKNVALPAMDCDIIPFYTDGGKNILPFWVEFLKISE